MLFNWLRYQLFAQAKKLDDSRPDVDTIMDEDMSGAR